MQRPLDPVSLQHFVAVCEEGNIARAAARESLVASALSKRIAALEAEVGVALLVRRRRGVEPTPAGQALLARSRELLSGLQQLRIELTGFTSAMRERLTAYGLFHEIIAWKLRIFVPTDAHGVEVLAKLMERYHLQRVADREVA